MAAKKWTGAENALWNKAKNWSPEGVPGVTSDVKFEAGAPNCEITAAAKCRSVDCTGYTGTLKHNVGAPLSIGTTSAPEGGIGLKLVAGMTYSGGTEAEILFVATAAAGVQKVFCGGQTLGIMAVEKAGSVKLEDTHKAAKVQLLEGTLDTNGQTCEWDFTCIGEAVRVLKLGASLVKLNGQSTVWNVSGSNFTLEAGTSTIEITDGGATAKQFNGGSKAYHDLILAGESNEVGNTKKISGNNSFHKLALNCPDTAANSGVLLETSMTQTIEELTTTAKSGKPLKLKNSVGETPGKLSKASGNVSVDWLEITNVETDNTVSWYAGANSTLTGATSFWKKEAPETGVTIPLNAASSTSAATLAVTAATTIPLTSASSTSGGQLALSATTQVALNAAASTSSATVALSAPTGVVLGSAASESAAGGLALQAPTGVGVLPAVSSSTASVTVSVVTQLSLASAASGSSAVAEVKTGGTPSVAASFGGTAGGSYVAAGGEGERGAVVVGAAGTVGSVIVTGGHQ